MSVVGQWEAPVGGPALGGQRWGDGSGGKKARSRAVLLLKNDLLGGYLSARWLESVTNK